MAVQTERDATTVADINVFDPHVLGRMKNLQLAGSTEILPSNWAYGLTKMPVTFTPGPRQGR